MDNAKMEEPVDRRPEGNQLERPHESFNFKPIGLMRSPLQKNGSPRQGNLAHVRGVIRCTSFAGNNEEHAFADLEGFSHVWLVWVFHENRGGDILRNKIRPPKIEGKKSLFATRTPHRPNPIGLSLVRLEKIEGTVLTVAGHDLIDGTPVLDIKPYIDEFDSAPDWRVPSWLPPREEAVKDFQLSWSPEALQLLAATPLSFYKPHEQQLFQDTLRDLLKLNPRSKYWAHTYGDYYYMKLDRVVCHMTFTADDAAIVDRIAVEDELIKF